MRFFTRFALKNPVAVWVIAIILVLGGAYSASQLQEELMPSIAIPVVAVITPYPGASPSAVAKDVTSPLEKALRGLQSVQDVLSSSVQNVSQIELQLSMSADPNAVAQKVQQTINQVKLPNGAMTPNVDQFSFSSSPIIYFTVSSNTATNEQLRNTVNQSIVPALQGVAGVANIQTDGSAPLQVQIQFNQNKLNHYQLSVAQVLQYLQSDNVSMPVGTTELAGTLYPAHLSGQFKSLASIRNLPIPLPTSPTAGIQSGFQQIGKSLGQLGQSVGQVGQAVGELGKSQSQLGQGVGLLVVENQILSNLQQIQGQTLGAGLQLAQELAKPKSAQNSSTIIQLESVIQGLQKAQQGLQSELKAIQAKLPSPAQGSAQNAGASGASGAGSGQIPAANSSTFSAPSSSAGTSASGSKNLSSIPLSDIATVKIAPPAGAAINRTNGKTSVLIAIVKTENSNTVAVAKAIQSKVQNLTSSLPYGLRIHQLYDAAGMIQSSISGLLREAILGAIFAALVILLFLRNLKTTLIAVISIPISLLTAMIILNALGITLNIMTLGGMAVATGRVVDDSIVVIENIFRSWRRGVGFGKKFVLKATGEVGHAITSSTITTIAVFLPLGLVSGLVGKIFLPFALTVIISLLSSLLVALTVVPLLAWSFVARGKAKGADYAWLEDGEHPNGAFTEFSTHSESTSVPTLRPWQVQYQRFLSWSLDHKITVILITAVALIASVFSLGSVGSTFLPQSSNKFATVAISMPIGTPLSATNNKARQVEHALLSYGNTVQITNSQIGSDPGQSQGLSVLGTNSASLFLKLNPNTHMNQFSSSLQKKLNALAGKATIQVQTMSTTGSASSFALIITGPNYSLIQSAAQKVTTALSHLNGLTNVQNNLAQTESEIKIVPNLKKATAYGLTPYSIASEVKNYLATNDLGPITLNSQSYEMVTSVKIPNGVKKLADIRALTISTQTGSNVPLSDVANVMIAPTPVSILHRNGNSYAQISGDFTVSNTGKVTLDALQKVSSLNLPKGISTSISGSSQQQNQSFSQLIEAVLVAIGMVYIVMLIAFGEWSAPFAILFSMPVALIGAFFGTVIGRQPVSVSSLIGILMLMGIVVTNAIVLVDRVEQQRRHGLTVREALLEAGTTRLRPILMTAIATICALTPLALGFSEGALISQGLAVVVVGGLVTSTILTLVLVPLVFELLHTRTIKKERLGIMPHLQNDW